MKQKILMALAVVSFLSVANAEDTVNWEEDTQEKILKQEKLKEMKHLVTKIDILLDEAILVGENSLARLEKTLDFLTRIETDAKFRDCVVLKENKKRIVPLRESANELLENREITQKQYRRYIKKLEVKESRLDKRISNKQCKEGA